MLSDFGVSRVIVASQVTTDTTSVKGSMRWMAPELFTPPDGASSNQPIEANEKTDVWAFGMTVYVDIIVILLGFYLTGIMQEILTGKRPFEHLNNDVLVMVAIISGTLPTPPEGLEGRPTLDKKLWELSKKCWIKYPLRRPLMKDLLEVVDNCLQGGLSVQDRAPETHEPVPATGIMTVENQEPIPAIGKQSRNPWWQQTWLYADNVPSQWKKEIYTDTTECFLVFNPHSLRRLNMDLMHELPMQGVSSQTYVLFSLSPHLVLVN
jgi:serine/threonine protein kinase